MSAAPNPWLSWRYVDSNWSEIWEHLSIHTTLTLQAVALAAAIALPLSLLARRVPRLEKPLVGVASVLYTVPSFALFALLAPVTGIGRTTVLIGLVMYALLVMVRNTVAGLAAVDPDVVEAARGMGFSRWRLMWSVELPQALPAIVAGLRLATVTTVALVTVGVVVGYGGLGQLMFRGFQSSYRAQISTSVLLCVALALALDLVIMGAARLAMPWARRRSR